ncbi:NC domain-containing protein-related [Striga hermonthica]|uniref:NC domain-containing protein-related n=1 Tax=Striga hermonthica TaxID=68872 RepID=A0A9N7MJN2_STRHE|nr:NC domain-containing protein-related [Striga hermonthica]
MTCSASSCTPSASTDRQRLVNNSRVRSLRSSCLGNLSNKMSGICACSFSLDGRLWIKRIQSGGSLYAFEYGVTPSTFLAKIHGSTCTTAPSDSPGSAIHRAMYLLSNGFGNYDVFLNNCEGFALYCMTGLLTVDRAGVGRSGQASSVIGAPLAALLSSPLKLLMSGPVGVAAATAGVYCASRYATDIGVWKNMVKVAVEDLAVNLGLGDDGLITVD